MKLVNVQVIKDELERLIRNYRFYSSWEAKYRYEAYKELSEWLDGLDVEEPSKNLEDEATKYAQDKYMPVQTAEAFRAGYNKCRQEMMNSAIEREVKVDAGGYPFIDATELYDYNNDKPLAKAGDKVKVLIVKDK